MKKWALAALLAGLLLALSQQHATAQCYNLAGSFHIKICGTGSLKAWCQPFQSNYCAHGGANGAGGYPGPAAAGYDPSGLVAPGPWYQYWPYDTSGYQTATVPSSYPGWNYESNFNAPAPTGYPWWPAPTTAPPVPVGAPAAGAAVGQLPAPAFKPVGYYPSYWYGH